MQRHTMQIIQLGLSFADADGKLSEGCPTWQFNFRFSLTCVRGCVGGGLSVGSCGSDWS